MAKRTLLLLALALLLLPAQAEEIVHFTNGTTMPVRSHETRDGMVHVDLGSNGFIAFPEYMVERIEVAGAKVKLKASTNGGKADKRPTVIASGPLKGAADQGPARTVPKSVNDGGMPGVEVDDKGVATVRPFAGSAHRRKREMRVSGSSAVFGAPPNTRNNGNGYRGTTRVGTKHVIGPTAPPRYRNKPVVTGMARVERSTAQPGQGQNGDQGGGSGDSGDSGSSGSGNDQ